MTRKLFEVARVFRCNLKRMDAPAQTKPILWKRGRLPVWHEVRLENIDQKTGFITGPLPVVRPEEDPEREAVQTRDILFCFHGTPERIRRPAMLLDEWAVIPGRTLGIIRPYGCDAVWLFYFICRAINNLELQMRNGRGFLNLDKIRNLEFELPPEETIKKINFIHGKIVADFKKYHTNLRKNLHDMARLNLSPEITPAPEKIPGLQ